jgi:hypothetical protein
VRFHFAVVALLAVCLQLAAIFVHFGSDLPHRILFISSYSLLLLFIVVNLKAHPALVVLGIGLLLNFTVIAANGGLMPTSPEVYAKYSWPEGVTVGHWIPGSKDILLERDDIRFYFLSDRFRWDVQAVVRDFSIGDVIIALGLMVTVGDILLPRFGAKPS